MGCFEKTGLSSMVITSKEKKSTKFIFKQILNTVCGVFLKIDTRSHGLDKQSAIPAPNQPHFKTVCEVV